MTGSFVLDKHPGFQAPAGPLVLIVLDGFGVGSGGPGDCVAKANPTNLTRMINEAKAKKQYCELKAHGKSVGLPDDTDPGNSEVGHNALGSGQLVAQGATLINNAIADGSLFTSHSFMEVCKNSAQRKSTVHLIGLLSDGNVHSRLTHVLALLEAFSKANVNRVRIHAWTDGRDVAPLSATTYIDQVEAFVRERCHGADYKFASGGGRMYVTMDRYEADWKIVKRGWDVMVHGRLDEAIVSEVKSNSWSGRFPDMKSAIETARLTFKSKNDQFYPPWVIVDKQDQPVGKVAEGDVVINFNFRGDRAIEISRAFESPAGSDFDTKCFSRGTQIPKVDYYGMLMYDNEQQIPKRFLCPNPHITKVLSEYMCASGVSQYAMSETHKFGHVTYFWNGNRTGYVDPKMELYEEVPSDSNQAILTNPEMKAYQIAQKCISVVNGGKYKFIRINFANGDMVGHTGSIDQTVKAVQVLDDVCNQIAAATTAVNGVTMITADHGNCEEKLDEKGNPKTSHTLNRVPLIVVDNRTSYCVDESVEKESRGLTNVAATVCNILGFKAPPHFRPSLMTPITSSN